MLAEEATRLHPLPAAPFSAAFGVTRTVGEHTPMVSFEAGALMALAEIPQCRSAKFPTCGTRGMLGR
jgi:hypothetical protein